MSRPISARISDDLYRAIQAQVDAGRFASRSEAIAHYLRVAVEMDLENTLRRVLREELARLQVAPPAPAPDNPKRARMLQKVVR